MPVAGPGEDTRFVNNLTTVATTDKNSERLLAAKDATVQVVDTVLTVTGACDGVKLGSTAGSLLRMGLAELRTGVADLTFSWRNPGLALDNWKIADDLVSRGTLVRNELGAFTLRTEAGIRAGDGRRDPDGGCTAAPGEQRLTSLDNTRILAAQRGDSRARVFKHAGQFLEGQWLRVRLEGLRKRYPDRDLMPFARRLDNDDVACWDQKKPASVYIVHEFSAPGWEGRGECTSFQSWYLAAQEEARDYDA